MSKNIFEGAKFGDAFKTRDGRKSIYLGLRDAGRKALMLYNISTSDWYIGDKKEIDICTGMVYNSLKTTSDIIGKWREPVSEEELEKMAWEKWEELYDEPHGIATKEAYKAGYRKAEEGLL